MSGMSVDEAIELYHSDPKPLPRLRDPEVFKRFHESPPDCLSCGWVRVQAHHVLPRSAGGDDCMDNLVGLCIGCHNALHGTPYRSYGRRIDASFVQDAIGRYLVREDGFDTLTYLRSKRSDGWIEGKYGVELNG